MSEQEIVLEDGTQPQPLDILDISLVDWKPSGHQQENWLLDLRSPWRRVGRYTWQQATELPTSQAALWIDGHSTYLGIENYVPAATAATLTDSLRLIQTRPIIHVMTPYDQAKPLQVWAQFQHAGQRYKLMVTDSSAEDRFRAQGVGTYPLRDSILTVSLGEVWNNQCYKLVAALIEKPAV